MKALTLAAALLAPIMLVSSVTAASTLAENTPPNPSLQAASTSLPQTPLPPHSVPSTATTTLPALPARKPRSLNSAPNLTDKDLFGNPGPFIEMWLDKNYKQRSKDAKGLNPVYNETFCFYVRPG
ncbi:hypothetical protein BGX23_009583 [Mortierella sp. AD031]|nr:hypothetical protein BGX23_009583 [Mortierella sp. AD031]